MRSSQLPTSAGYPTMPADEAWFPFRWCDGRGRPAFDDLGGFLPANLAAMVFELGMLLPAFLAGADTVKEAHWMRA